MPLSLQTEVQLKIFSSMIESSHFFELSDPTFILSIVRKLRQELAAPKDKICREGEDANFFYFIKEGNVEVMTKGEIEELSVLRKGCYFGEIGLLL